MKKIEETLLETHVTIEKLKFERKGILKDFAVFGSIAVVIILLGVYAQYAEWSEYPILQTSIFLGGILFAIAFRPLQQYKKKLASTEEKRSELETILQKENLDYKVDVRVTKNEKGEFDIKKSIQLFTIKEK